MQERFHEPVIILTKIILVFLPCVPKTYEYVSKFVKKTRPKVNIETFLPGFTLHAVIPSPPQNVIVVSQSSRAVNISWTPGFNGHSDILNYTVEISINNQNFRAATCQGLSSSACVVSSSFTSASLTGLHPGRTYNIRVFATNKVGPSAASSDVNTTTDEEGTHNLIKRCGRGLNDRFGRKLSICVEY